ncbi:MAG: hypothetical protein L0196_07615 [candidate division Zixibacteria bacterium]|nr:hypothetical protein [candidate division Zixibacteria bacterium]
MTENKIEKELTLLKAELAREVKSLFAVLTALTTGSPPQDTEGFDGLGAEKLLELKRKLKQKLDAALAVSPAADVRFKSQQK